MMGAAMRTVTKKEVIGRTAQMVGEKFTLTEKIVNATFGVLRDLMVEADPEIRIEIRRFGVLLVKVARPKPRARNPRTGEIIGVPARRKVHFRAGKYLREILKRPVEEVP